MKTPNPRTRTPTFVAFALLGVAIAGAGIAHAGRQRAHHALQALDVDGNRAITRDEIQASASERFAQIDANHDAQVTIDEIRAHRQKQREQRQIARLARVDGDGDGRISEAEFVAHRLERLERLDRNDDGVLDATDRRGRGAKR